MTNIDVSIVMITYNQEKYVAKAIESVLMQNTNLKYELVIGDDCSQDNTPKIIREFAERYPDKINAILREKNIGMRKNTDDLRRRCRGKYMVSLEGDDYWTDAQKLQIQFDFLEKNPEYIAVSHWCEVVDENNNVSNNYEHKYRTFNFEKSIYTIKDYKNNRIPGHINTIMHKNIYLNPKFEYEKIYNVSKTVGDRTSYLILSLLGDIYVMNKVMSHYRYVQKKGESNYSSRIIEKNTSAEWYYYYSNLEKEVKNIMNLKVSLKKLRFDKFISSIWIFLKKPTNKNKKVLKSIYSDISIWEILTYSQIALIQKCYNYYIWRKAE